MSVTFEVPGKPHGKGRPRFSRGGHAYTDEATRAYEKSVGDAWRDTHTKMIEGPVCAYITAFYPVPKSVSKKKAALMRGGEFLPCVKPDIDNVVKAILDGAILCGAIRDDSDVVRVVASKKYGEPKVVVTLAETIRGRFDRANAGDTREMAPGEEYSCERV